MALMRGGTENDGFVKSPDAALRCILPRLSTGLAYCGVLLCTLIPHDWRALPANFLRNHHNFDFLRIHQKMTYSQTRKDGRSFL
jgi:hypothetical protein